MLSFMLTDVFVIYLSNQKRYSKHTVAAYATDLKQFNIYLKDVYELSCTCTNEVQELNFNHIRSWQVQLSLNKVTPKSIARKLSTIKSYFRFLKQNNYISVNITTVICAPKIAKSLPKFIKENQLSLLLSEIDFGEGIYGQRNRLILELFYATGMRRAELINLKFSEVDFSNKILKITGKGNKVRYVPVNEELLNRIDKYKKVLEEASFTLTHHHLFFTQKGQPLYPKMVYNIVKKYLGYVTTAVKKSPHISRHSFATHLTNNGANLNAVKELLGHQSLAATQIYTHNSIKQLKDEYNKAHPKSKNKE